MNKYNQPKTEITDQQRLWLMYKCASMTDYEAGRDALRRISAICNDMGIPRAYYKEIGEELLKFGHPVTMLGHVAKLHIAHIIAGDYPIDFDADRS